MGERGGTTREPDGASDSERHLLCERRASRAVSWFLRAKRGATNAGAASEPLCPKPRPDPPCSRLQGVRAAVGRPRRLSGSRPRSHGGTQSHRSSWIPTSTCRTCTSSRTSPVARDWARSRTASHSRRSPTGRACPVSGPFPPALLGPTSSRRSSTGSTGGPDRRFWTVPRGPPAMQRGHCVPPTEPCSSRPRPGGVSPTRSRRRRWPERSTLRHSASSSTASPPQSNRIRDGPSTHCSSARFWQGSFRLEIPRSALEAFD